MTNLVEGWTERIRYRLYADGVSPSLSGATVALIAHSRQGVALTMAGTAGVVDAGTAEVYYDPAANDFSAANSPLQVRWKVTIGGKVAFFPNADQSEQWVISAP